MLPLEEPTHVDGGSDSLDLFAERGDGSTVNSLEDAALAPLDVVVGVEFGCGIFEDASHEEALPSPSPGKAWGIDRGGIEAEDMGKRVAGSWTKDL